MQYLGKLFYGQSRTDILTRVYPRIDFFFDYFKRAGNSPLLRRLA
jgi:hypothetical protein